MNFLRASAVISLLAGIFLAVGNEAALLSASLSKPGSPITIEPAQTEMIHATDSLIDAYEQAFAAQRLVLGILLILLGMFLYAFCFAREERQVHITTVPKKKLFEERRTVPLRIGRNEKVYWVEVRL